MQNAECRMQVASCRSLPFRRVTSLRLDGLAQPNVTIVTYWVDRASGECGANGAVWLMNVSAAGEVALAQVGPKLAKAPIQLLQRKIPQTQLANAGSVGHIAAARQVERDQLSDAGGVAALV